MRAEDLVCELDGLHHDADHPHVHLYGQVRGPAELGEPTRSEARVSKPGESDGRDDLGGATPDVAGRAPLLLAPLAPVGPTGNAAMVASNTAITAAAAVPPRNVSTGPTRKVVRLAVAATGEWTAAAGGLSAAYAKLVQSVNSMNGVFGRDLGVRLELVTGPELLYTNAASDPYTNSNKSAMLNENRANLDAVVGNANFDVGHVLGTSGGGVAYLRAVGNSSLKGGGVSANNPNGSSYELTFMHELGHQFGSGHTFNFAQGYADQRFADSAYEPGPGSTLLSYGGIGLAGNFVSQRDRYFHAGTIEKIGQHLESTTGRAAGRIEQTGNDAPTVNAGPDRAIPAGTPFELTGSAGDQSQAALTYGWEQYDLGDADPIGVDDGDGPLFRSRPATAGATRSFPELSDIRFNSYEPDETLPSVSRGVAGGRPTR